MKPILFDLWGFSLPSFWTFTCIGLFISIYLFGYLAQKSRLRLQFVLEIGWKLIISALIFGRFFAILKDTQFYFSNFGFWKFIHLFTIWDKDISFWGAILGIIIVFAKNAYRKRENINKWGDPFAISLMVGLIFGNLGTFFSGLNYGKVTNLPLGMTFNSAYIKYTVPIHPTQLYAIIYTIIIAVGLYYIYTKYKGQYEGLISLLALTSFSGFKFLEEFFRGDDVMTVLNIRIPQLIFLGLFIYGCNKLYDFQQQNNLKFLRVFETIYSKILFLKFNRKKNV
jgi:prolipoprotein diacylglyceryltransferase